MASPPSPFSSASGTAVPDLPSPTGPRAGDYTYREGLEHKCKRDMLLGRLRSAEDQTWKRIRPRPTKTSFVGSYYLCKGGWAAAGAGGTAKGPAAHSWPRLCASPQADRQTDRWSGEDGVNVRTNNPGPDQLCRQTRASGFYTRAGALAAPGWEDQRVLIRCWAPKGYGKDVERTYVKHWRLYHSKGLTDTSF